MLNNKHKTSSVIDMNKNENLVESTTRAIVKKTRNKSEEDENLNESSTRVASITVSEAKSTNKNNRKESSQNRKKFNEDKLNKMSSKSVSPSTENRLASFTTSLYCQFSFKFAFLLSWLPKLLTKHL